MDSQAFLRLKGLEKLPKVLVLEGDEPFFKEEILERMRGFLPTAQRAEIQVRKTNGLTALEECRGGSLFGGQKIVIAREAEPILEEYLPTLRDHAKRGRNFLILLVEKYGRRTKMAKEAEADFSVITCKRLYESPPPWMRGAKPWENPLAEWALAEGIRQGLQLSLETAFLLSRICGNNLYEIRSTFEKVKLAGHKEIGQDAVEALAGKSRVDDVQAVTTAVTDRDWRKALVVVGRLFQRGLQLRDDRVFEPSVIGVITVSQLWARVKELLKLREHFDRGGSRQREAAAKASGAPAFLVERLSEAVLLWRSEDLRKAANAIEEAELCLKGLEAGGPPRMVLEKLIVRLSLSGK